MLFTGLKKPERTAWQQAVELYPELEVQRA
jgi:hypothetical protein